MKPHQAALKETLVVEGIQTLFFFLESEVGSLVGSSGFFSSLSPKKGTQDGQDHISIEGDKNLKD